MMEKGLKIAYLTPHIRCDPNRTQFQRPKHLSLKNTLFIFTSKETALPEEMERKLRVIRGPLKFGRLGVRPFYPLWCVYKVLTIHRKFRFDLVYSTYDCYSWLSAAILKLLGFKWVADIWDHPEIWRDVKERDIKKRLLVNMPRIMVLQIVKRSLKYADLVISVIPLALRRFHVDPEEIFAVTNGVDLSITKPKGLKRSDAEFRVFYVGFVMKERGLDLMLRALALLNGRIEGLKFILVGDARREDVVYLNRTVKKLGLEEQVDFRKKLKHRDVLTLIEGSDVCLCANTTKEPFDLAYPIKIFEYMAMGKVVVSTRLTGTSVVITNGVNGLLVQPNSPKEMADAIFKLYTNPDLRKKLEVNARKTAKKYDWNIINERINRKLTELFKRTKES